MNKPNLEKQPHIKELLKDLARKYQITYEDARVAIHSQFDYTAKVMASGTLDKVYIPYFGVFNVPPHIIKQIQNGRNVKCHPDPRVLPGKRKTSDQDEGFEG